MLSRVVMLAAVVIGVALLVPKLGLTDRPDAAVAPATVEAPVASATPLPEPKPRPSDSPRRVALDADPSGHFLATAVINGRSVEMMVDTGATDVALSEATASRLGIRPLRSAFKVPVSTANGIVMVAAVRLNEVRVGGISIRDVEATVVPGNALGTDLLGMSFLGRLSRFEMSGDQLVLHR